MTVFAISPRAWMLVLRTAARQSADERTTIDLVATFDALIADGIVVQCGDAFVLACECRLVPGGSDGAACDA